MSRGQRFTSRSCWMCFIRIKFPDAVPDIQEHDIEVLPFPFGSVQTCTKQSFKGLSMRTGTPPTYPLWTWAAPETGPITMC